MLTCVLSISLDSICRKTEKHIPDKTITSSFSGSRRADSPLRAIHTFLVSSLWLSLFPPLLLPSAPLCLSQLFTALHLIHPYIHPNRSSLQIRRLMGPLAAHIGREADYSLDRSPLYHRNCRDKNTPHSRFKPWKKIYKYKYRGPDLRLRNISPCNTEAIYEAVNIGKTTPSISPTA